MARLTPLGRGAAAPADPRHSRAHFDEAWGQAAVQPLCDPGNARRVATIAELCPEVDSLLEVGCGDGEVLRALAGRARRRTGCDTSPVGLQTLLGRDSGVRVVQAAADRLPFGDRSFELVACCDVLEHLPEAAATQAVTELMRVAGRYVLVNVPLAEDLGWSQIRCACGRVYHRDHHQRSYSLRQAEELLPANTFRLLDRRTTGWTVRHPFRLLPGLGPALGLGHDPKARCDRCGARPGPLPRPRQLLRDAFVLGLTAATRPARRLFSRDTEIVVLFGRRS